MVKQNEVHYPILFSKFDLGKHRIRNRIIHASMSTGYAKDGIITKRLIAYHANRAAGGAAIIVTEPLASLRSQMGGPRVQIYHARNKDGLKRWADAVESQDCRLLGQLMDAGRGRHHPGRNPYAIGPSPLPDDLSWTVPHALTTDEVESMIGDFTRGAQELKRSGFSGVEFSCGHGHLFHQFLSPWSNRREDQFGGDVEGRTRLIRDLIQAIRSECGEDFIVGLKLPGEDGVPGSIDVTEAEKIVRMIAPLKVADYFCFAQGSHHSSLEMHVPDMHYPRTPYLEITKQLGPAAGDTPVVALGRITDPEQAEKILDDGIAQLVALGRTLLADPAWGVKAQEGREVEIRPCLSCNTCWGLIIDGNPLGCVSNPRAGTPNEAVWRPKRAKKKKRIVVVGSGIAGLEAAWVAAARGHEVTLFGVSQEIGGKTSLHAALPGCDALSGIFGFQHEEALSAGVKFELGTEATLDDVKGRDPHAVILATGSTMTWPSCLPEDLKEDGAVSDLRVVVTFLAGRIGLQKGTAVIYDHDHTAGTYAAAEFIRDLFDHVILLTPRAQIARDEPMVTRQSIYRRIYGKDIEVVLLSEPLHESRFLQGEVSYQHVYTKEVKTIKDVELLTFSTPRQPSNSMVEPLRNAGIDVRVVGDCYAPRNTYYAMKEGHEAGNAI